MCVTKYMNKDVKFRLKDGRLTLYSLACGYVQKEGDDENYKQLYMEHSHFHIQAVRAGKIVIWLTYDSNELTKARKDFKNTKI